MKNSAFIIDGIRTPIGQFGGSLSAVRADDLGAHVLRQLLARNPQIPADAYEAGIMGGANQAGEDNRNVARMSLLLAGMPVSVPGETVNRLCASGLSAVIHARRAILAGDGHLFIAGGLEQMTRGPWVMSKSARPFGNDMQLFDSSFGWRFINPAMQATYGTDAMGETAENLVDLYQIDRRDQDQFACWSQQKAAAARDAGRLAEEIAAVDIPQRKGAPLPFSQDEFIKPQTTLEGLAQLRPAFRKQGGSVTAGNASGLNDGAAALIVASSDAVARYGLRPQARILSAAVAGVEPRIMGIGPVAASQKALQQAGLQLADMDLIEINEAFAAQVLACTRALGLADDDARINPNGGAIALGHPLGMSGARLALTAARELQRSGKRYALVTMCIGVGQGYAAVLEAVV
jgi:3-oxoadipyl-CoA thiolase